MNLNVGVTLVHEATDVAVVIILGQTKGASERTSEITEQTRCNFVGVRVSWF